jgi:hypothetical protein
MYGAKALQILTSAFAFAEEDTAHLLHMISAYNITFVPDGA